MHNVKQELGIKKNVFKLTIYVTYNKTSNTVIIYYTCTKTIDAPGHPKPPPPKSHPLGHDPGLRTKILSDFFNILLWEHTQTLV